MGGLCVHQCHGGAKEIGQRVDRPVQSGRDQDRLRRADSSPPLPTSFLTLTTSSSTRPRTAFPHSLRIWPVGRPNASQPVRRLSQLDKTPSPLWNLIKMRRYFSMNLQYSRGCPFSCEFCDITTLYGNHTRTKSALQIVGELEALYKAGWRGSVFFVDDNFIGNKKRLNRKSCPLWLAG